MARVRVCLITYRRPALLPRALASLRAQTFADWTCEVHNNDPADANPAALVAAAADARIGLVNADHPVDTVEAFNRAHQPAVEPYQTLLEDDNWWEPNFLATMVAILDRHPNVDLAWSNMRVWREEADGSWADTGRKVWHLDDGPPREFRWPSLLQFDDCLYSNGSMLLRSRVAGRLLQPPDLPRDLFEQCRERMMNFPTLLVPAPLANFAITRHTVRSTNYSVWGEMQTLLGAAFLAQVPLTADARAALWAHRRRLRPRSTSSLMFAGLVQRDWAFLRHAQAADWMLFIRGWVRRPLGSWRILRLRPRQRQTWQWLNAQLAARTAEARARGFVALTANSLLDKQNPGQHGLSPA